MSDTNTLTDSFPTYHSKRMQVKRGKLTIYKDICSFEERATLVKGAAVKRPYRSALVVKALGDDGAYIRQALTDTAETLTVNQEPSIAAYVTDSDAIQSNYKTMNHYSDDAMKRIDEFVDGDVLGEYASASSIVANYEMGGGGSASDGIGFTLTTSNVMQVFGKANKKIDRKHVARKDRWAVISPEFFDILWQFIGGKESALGDKVGTNPNEIGVYGGFRLFVSEQTGWSARLEFATNPTANDTITINGAVFTWKADTITTAGYIHICSTAALSLDQLVSAINTPGTSVTEATDAGFYALSTANQNALSGIVATDGTTYMTLKGEGYGFIAVSEGLSAAADIWTTTKQLQHNLFGQGKPIDLVMQKVPKIQLKDRSDASYGYTGQDFVVWGLYGLKTFAEGADALVDVQIRSDAF